MDFERRCVVDYLRYLAEQGPPPEIIARNPTLFTPEKIRLGQLMLQSAAMQIENGGHVDLALARGAKP